MTVACKNCQGVVDIEASYCQWCGEEIPKYTIKFPTFDYTFRLAEPMGFEQLREDMDNLTEQMIDLKKNWRLQTFEAIYKGMNEKAKPKGKK